MANGLIEDLADSECLSLLKTHHFGRVAFVQQADGPPSLAMHSGTRRFRLK
jgi:hypothetical protein